MVYQELVNYIRNGRAQGFTDADIRRALLESGWKDADIGPAFRAAESFSEKERSVEPAPLRMEPRELASALPQPQSRVSPAAAEPAKAKEPAVPAAKEEPHEPSGMLFGAWTGMWRDPLRTLAREKYASSFGRTVGHWFASVFLFLLLAVIIAWVAHPFPPGLLALVLPPAVIALLSALYVFQLIFVSFAFLNYQIVASAIYHLTARVFGGKGNYSTTAHLLSVSAASAVLLYAVLLGADILVISLFSALKIDPAITALIAAIIAIVPCLAYNSRVLGSALNSPAKGFLASLMLALAHLALVLAGAFLLFGQFIQPLSMSLSAAALAEFFIASLFILQIPLASLSGLLLSLRESEGVTLGRAIIVHFFLFIGFLLVAVFAISPLLSIIFSAGQLSHAVIAASPTPLA